MVVGGQPRFVFWQHQILCSIVTPPKLQIPHPHQIQTMRRFLEKLEKKHPQSPHSGSTPHELCYAKGLLALRPAVDPVHVTRLAVKPVSAASRI